MPDPSLGCEIKSGAWTLLLQQRRSWLKGLQRQIRIFRHNVEGINAPWILVVEAKCNLIDSVGVGHDQVEAILQRKGTGKDLDGKKGDTSRSPLANLTFTNWCSAVLVGEMRQKGAVHLQQASPLT